MILVFRSMWDINNKMPVYLNLLSYKKEPASSVRKPKDPMLPLNSGDGVSWLPADF
jgi:hypothetical protein